jgi:hypothetical protein
MEVERALTYDGLRSGTGTAGSNRCKFQQVRFQPRPEGVRNREFAG